jgi:hypothetical protein
MSSYIGTFFMWNQISACFNFTWPEKLYPFLSAIYLEPTVLDMQIDVTCPVGSTLSWSAEYKQEISLQMLYMFEEIGSIWKAIE